METVNQQVNNVLVEAEDNFAQKEQLFNSIKEKVLEQVSEEFISSLQTKNGETQASERQTISVIRKIMNDMGLSFVKAGSQEPKDFQNVGGIGLDIEVKKTDSGCIYFNDTCPTKDIFYIIFCTGKKTKEGLVKSQMVFTNGNEFIKDSPWIVEYTNLINKLKDEYARGESKKKYGGCMSVYPRPTYKADIRFLLDVDKEIVAELKAKKDAEKAAKEALKAEEKAAKEALKAEEKAKKEALKAEEKAKKEALKAEAKVKKD